jgi:hypothetical protein
LHLGPWFHNYALGLHNYALAGGGELAGGELWPKEMNKWHEASIGLTSDRLMVVARSGTAPASGGDKTVAVRLPRLGLRR